jgi:uncharacterized membrane protein YbaN (DUF454 family)
LRNACGIALIGLGLVAMPLPILPGIPLVLAGAALLGSSHPLIRPFRAWIDKFRAKTGGA